MSHTETEVKIQVTDLEWVEDMLKAVGAERSAERVYERNVRYEDACGSLTPVGQVVRLRQDTRVRLTYKEPQPASDAQFSSRTELEVTVSDFETMNLILGKLGYHPAWIYEKYRTTYKLLGAEVVLDEMPIGLFVEVEGEPDSIDAALRALHLQDSRRLHSSYSDLFFQTKSRMKLTFQDMTFENFKGIAVPDGIFE